MSVNLINKLIDTYNNFTPVKGMSVNSDVINDLNDQLQLTREWVSAAVPILEYIQRNSTIAIYGGLDNDMLKKLDNLLKQVSK